MLTTLLIDADDARDFLRRVPEDALDFVLSRAERTGDGKASDGAISQTLLRLGLEHGLGDGGILAVLVVCIV